jgi:hypothetical protein
MKWILPAMIGLSLSVLTSGCNDPVAPPAPTPVAPTITETFDDTLLVAGSNSHTFNVQQVGGLKVGIANVTPSAAVNLAVGTSSVSGCIVINNLTAVAGAAAQISGTATVPGTFCVLVSDVGNLVEPVTYTVTVIHS